MIQNVIIGTEKKLAVTINKTPEFDISNSNHVFQVELFCNGTCVYQVPPSNIKESDNEYTRIITFNTKDVGCGRLKCRIIAQIPDGDFKQDGDPGIRTEIYDFITDLNIVGGLK